MEEIYETELWKRLEKNSLFSVKIEEILRRCLYYTKRDNIRMNVIGNKLVISYRSNVIERENNCQFVDETKYEVFLDNDDNLVINEASGILRSNYGYGFNNTDGGVLDTHYSCEVYDNDGVELSFQAYSDSHCLEKNMFDTYKIGFMSALDNAYNPNLVSFANSTGAMLHANIIGELPMFTRQIRSKNDLGVVISSTCQFEKNGKAVNPKEEYYFNTFLSQQAILSPTKMSVARGYPFATVDANNVMKFNEIYTNVGLTSKNYKEVANARFLSELEEEKIKNGKHAPKDVVEKYDLMIEKLRSHYKSDVRTR